MQELVVDNLLLTLWLVYQRRLIGIAYFQAHLLMFDRDKYALESGMQVMRLLKDKIRLRDIVTLDLKNAAVI